MLLGENGKHLHLNDLHLFIQLLEAHHLALVLVYFGLQRAIAHLSQRGVNVEEFMPGRQELTEVIVAVLLDTRVVVPGGCVNLSPLHWSIRRELLKCVRVGRHVD